MPYPTATRREAAMLGNVRPQPIERETFETFLIHDGSISGTGRATLAGTHTSLDEAISDGTRSHKGRFVVRQTDALTGAVMLKFYAVKRKSKPAYRYHNYETRAIHDLYAEHLVDLRGDALP